MPDDTDNIDNLMYAGGSDTFDESAGRNIFNEDDLPQPEPLGEGAVVIGGTVYTQNPDGTGDGDDGATFTNTDFNNYKDSTIAIGDTDMPGAGGTVGGVDIPAGLTPGGNSASTWEKYAKQFGLIKDDGTYDLKKLLALAGTTVVGVGALTQPTQKIRSIADLRTDMPAQSAMNTTGFSPETLAMMQRPMQTGSALQRVYAADMASPLTQGQTTRKYADGGEVMGALSQAFEGAVMGSDSGQSDLVEARLSPGEYVMDAESVSALGDGNTAAGIAKLDELRQQLRAQKRAAPNSEIPPQAQGPLSYMQGA